MHVTIALLRITLVGIFILKSHIKVIINERRRIMMRSEGNEVKHFENNRIKMDYSFSIFCII